MQLIIPCSGRGSRFHQFTDKPKYFIEIAGRPMLDWAIQSMKMPIQYSKVVIIIHKNQNIQATDAYDLFLPMVRSISDSLVVIVQEKPLEGAADSILLAKNHLDPTQPVAVWNCDQWCVGWDSKEVIKNLQQFDGSILTFKDPTLNKKWSYVKLSTWNFVTEVKEKDPISENATVGAYFFKTGRDLFWAIEEMILAGEKTNNEFYLAPVYNYLIKLGRKICTTTVNGFEGLGTPEDLDLFCTNHKLPDWKESLK